MLWALSLVELLWVLMILSIITFVVIAFFRHWHWTQLLADSRIGLLGREVFSAVTATITLVVFLFTMLDYTHWWRLAWTPNRLFDLNALEFPDLNGKWHGSLSSNRRGEGKEDGDCPWLKPGDRERFGCYAVDVNISMGLFNTKVALKLGAANSESKGVSLMREGDGFQIMYLFVRNHPSDSSFNGAAILTGDTLDLRALEGHYWTDRNWDSNNQTAGHVRLEKTGR
jgi:SMODS-associating 2TM, beta-strand rich effector domain